MFMLNEFLDRVGVVPKEAKLLRHDLRGVQACNPRRTSGSVFQQCLFFV